MDSSVQKIILIILDGFGIGKEYEGNAYFKAKKPHFESYFREYPWVKLKASGHAVGVPEGTQGGSEVGHFTIGAGRVVFQSLETINRSIVDESFFNKPALAEACRRVREANSKGEKTALHLIGMISDQGVHSDIRHLFALLELAKKEKTSPVYIHAILDGRDVPEKSAAKFIKQILEKIHQLGLDGSVSIATMIGRYYAMDRDTNWDRTEKAHDLYTLGKGTAEDDPFEALEHAYHNGAESDYYVPPVLLDTHATINGVDSVIFWNFRTDRARQLTWAFTGEKLPEETGLSEIGFKPKKIVRPFFVCLGDYSQKAPVVFPTPVVKNNLGEVVSNAGVSQLRIAETEKYAHVTFFMNSQKEKPFSGEDRMLIESPKCPSYTEKPEMSAYEITDRLLCKIDEEKYGLIVCNYANCDLVGHSGNLQASIRAVETIDKCLGKLVPHALERGYEIMIAGDHGNVEYMLYENGEPCPSHTTNPVPFIFISKEKKPLRAPSGSLLGELQDIAPTILKILNIEKPQEMTGESLI